MPNQKSLTEDEKYDAKSRIYVAKIGGSAFDLVEEDRKDANQPGYLRKVFNEIAQAHLDGYKIVLTCGAGPWGDASKNFGKYFEDMGFEQKPSINDIATSAIFAGQTINKILASLTPTEKTPHSSQMEHPDTLGRLISQPDLLERHIPVLYCAPETATADYFQNPQLSKSESDSHTIVIADWLAQRNAAGAELFFIKDTKGVFPYDPNRKDIDQSKNTKIKEISIDDFLDPKNIDRTGTDGRGEHLLETTAGNLFRDKVVKLETIRVLNARDFKLRQVLAGENRGSIIYNKHYKKKTNVASAPVPAAQN